MIPITYMLLTPKESFFYKFDYEFLLRAPNRILGMPGPNLSPKISIYEVFTKAQKI